MDDQLNEATPSWPMDRDDPDERAAELQKEEEEWMERRRITDEQQRAMSAAMMEEERVEREAESLRRQEWREIEGLLREVGDMFREEEMMRQMDEILAEIEEREEEEVALADFFRWANPVFEWLHLVEDLLKPFWRIF